MEKLIKCPLERRRAKAPRGGRIQQDSAPCVEREFSVPLLTRQNGSCSIVVEGYGSDVVRAQVQRGGFDRKQKHRAGSSHSMTSHGDFEFEPVQTGVTSS